ncbi:MAG: hypothetical protein VXZ72_04090 [Chlamydiota bacterium]|nr:hypothetical protein [Chlamydiota bacterium]
MLLERLTMSVKEILKEWQEGGVLPPALLFYGAHQRDQLEEAKRFAREFIGPNHSFNLLVFSHDEGKQYPIEDIREMVGEILRPPCQRGKKIVVIAGADQMAPEAANVLLKSLEEPPEHTHIILIAPAPGSLLPTLASRTLHLHFPSLPIKSIQQELMHQGLDSESAYRYAHLSQGSSSRAKELVAATTFPLLIEGVYRWYYMATPLPFLKGESDPYATELFLTAYHAARDHYLVAHGIDHPLFCPGWRKQLQSLASPPDLNKQVQKIEAAREAYQLHFSLDKAFQLISG